MIELALALLVCLDVACALICVGVSLPLQQKN